MGSLRQDATLGFKASRIIFWKRNHGVLFPLANLLQRQQQEPQKNKMLIQFPEDANGSRGTSSFASRI
ncbi:predicted protein [Botrytis cinerea T4]|uniref:Uncharacterized protein n=1 Tax=Botryotinia fuckeliana (strain T4) TaxID=999810 RepID=G2XT03_BOTF4|nr:predicted protein [Botrytis cinerea T4]